MCGIGGILSVGHVQGHLGERLAELTRRLRHRGPDGEAQLVFPSGLGGLVHTRLAMIAPSSEAAQPMKDGVATTIVFNGQLYNYRELRSRLEHNLGIGFTTGSDTEVLLRHMIDNGEGLSSLRGMFAFALVNEVSKSGMLARDRYGVKPLYYYCDEKELIFASELRALIGALPFTAEIDPCAVQSFLLWGAVYEPGTMIKNVALLPAGHRLDWKIDNDVLRHAVTRWHHEGQTCDVSAEPPWNSFGDSHHSESLRRALIDTVDSHLVADRPVGICLSGGIDSVALACTAVSGGHHPHAVTISFDGSEDEEYARVVAKRLQLQHSVWLLNDDEARHLYHEYLTAMDQPTLDGFNSFCLGRFLSELGIPAALSGIGADEWFGGYPSFSRIPKLLRIGQVFGWQWVARLLHNRSCDERWMRIGSLNGDSTLLDYYQSVRGIWSRSSVDEILGQLSPREHSLVCRSTELSGSDLRLAISWLERSLYMRNQLLRDADTFGMASGVELRPPYLDAEFERMLNSVPLAVRFSPQKALLRSVALGLVPRQIVYRPKNPFHLPISRWLSAEIDTKVGGVLAKAGRKAIAPWYCRLSLFILSDWLSRNGFSITEALGDRYSNSKK